MGTPTPRLTLLKPDPTDIVDVVNQINANYDKIDQWAGTILVNDGVTPPNSALFDGAIVKEKTSGQVWVAQWNGTGYDKKYIVGDCVAGVVGITGNTSVAGASVLTVADIPAVPYQRIISCTVFLTSVTMTSGTFTQVSLLLGGVQRLLVRVNSTAAKQGASGSYVQVIPANTTLAIDATGTVDAGTGTIAGDTRLNNFSYLVTPFI